MASPAGNCVVLGESVLECEAGEVGASLRPPACLTAAAGPEPPTLVRAALLVAPRFSLGRPCLPSASIRRHPRAHAAWDTVLRGVPPRASPSRMPQRASFVIEARDAWGNLTTLFPVSRASPFSVRIVPQLPAGSAPPPCLAAVRLRASARPRQARLSLAAACSVAARFWKPAPAPLRPEQRQPPWRGASVPRTRCGGAHRCA